MKEENGIVGLEETLIYVNDQNENAFYAKNEIKWHGKILKSPVLFFQTKIIEQ